MPPPKTDCHLNENPFVTGGPALVVPPPRGHDHSQRLDGVQHVVEVSLLACAQAPVEPADLVVGRLLRALKAVSDTVFIVVHRVGAAPTSLTGTSIRSRETPCGL